uniref:Uncharacterized protein n=1 Tax=Tanacetum cinerariifolium TaxID=118510 RepID=A0A6L2MKA9_TANCI|nr:hypothetical protein [Tanacetum cinerariifolium]
MCDVPFHDNSPPLKISKDQFEDFSDSNDDSTSIDDDSFSIDDIDTTTHSDFSLYDSFIFDLLINPFPPADRSDFYEFADELAHIISPPEYDCFCFKNEPNSGDFTMDVVEDTFPTREPRVHVHNVLPTYPTLQLIAPQYLLSFGNEDTIFDPGISICHSFMPDVSHRSGTFIKNQCSSKTLEWKSDGDFIFYLLPHEPMNSGSSLAQDSVNKN